PTGRRQTIPFPNRRTRFLANEWRSSCGRIGFMLVQMMLVKLSPHGQRFPLLIPRHPSNCNETRMSLFRTKELVNLGSKVDIDAQGTRQPDQETHQAQPDCRSAQLPSYAGQKSLERRPRDPQPACSLPLGQAGDAGEAFRVDLPARSNELHALQPGSV